MVENVNPLDRYGSALNSAVAYGGYEKNQHDKMLAMRTILRCEEILQKETWTVTDVNLLFTLATSDELKLFRSDQDHDRKYLGKCEIWIGQDGKLYTHILRAREGMLKLWGNLEEKSKEERAKDPVSDLAWRKSKERAELLQAAIITENTESLRQCFNTYFFIIRSSLSINGGMIDMMGEDRRKISYSGLPDSMAKAPEQRWPQ